MPEEIDSLCESKILTIRDCITPIGVLDDGLYFCALQDAQRRHPGRRRPLFARRQFAIA
jgi:hypothetical protein